MLCITEGSLLFPLTALIRMWVLLRSRLRALGRVSEEPRGSGSGGGGKPDTKRSKACVHANRLLNQLKLTRYKMKRKSEERWNYEGNVNTYANTMFEEDVLAFFYENAFLK